MSVGNILGLAYGPAALSVGVFLIRYSIRVSAWQTRMARENRRRCVRTRART